MSFRRFLKHLGIGRRRPDLTDIAELARDAGEVIAARTHRAMTGTLTAAEAHRMVAEKQAAGMKAYFAFAKDTLKGDLNAAPFSSFKVFRKAVSANRRRLRRRRS